MSERPAGIDPRGPRFGAAITSVLLLATVLLGLLDRAVPAFLLLTAVALLFLWSVLSPRTAPWAILFRTAVQPRLAPPTDLEDPRPPRFAQAVGLTMSVVGVVLHLFGLTWAIPVFATIAFMAAFLNAAFGFCLGCQMWLLLQRVGLVGRARRA